MSAKLNDQFFVYTFKYGGIKNTNNEKMILEMIIRIGNGKETENIV